MSLEDAPEFIVVANLVYLLLYPMSLEQVPWRYIVPSVKTFITKEVVVSFCWLAFDIFPILVFFLFFFKHIKTDIDGAYFGTAFPHLFLMYYPSRRPKKVSSQSYVPRVFGFKLHKPWREQQKEEYFFFGKRKGRRLLPRNLFLWSNTKLYHEVDN